MRVVIVSRVFAPEASAASMILTSISEAFRDAGHRVTVLTVRPPRQMVAVDPGGVSVKRARVLRDSQGYVRGYLPYLSFDLPLAFRLLLRPRADVYFVEPPPTTGAVVRVVTVLLRRPYFYRAADIWSDAAGMATDSRTVVRLLRRVERFALRGAKHLFATSPEVAARARELGSAAPTTVTGWGIDAKVFRFRPRATPAKRPYFIYAGTHSEWHGAGIFIEGFAAFSLKHPEYGLVFVGNGSERLKLAARAAELDLTTVEFREAVPATELCPLLSDATASLASLRPGCGYDYAFTTKVFASLSSGCPIVFSGVGPTRDFIEDARRHRPVGQAVAYDAEAVAEALLWAANHPLSESERRSIASWTATHHSLDAIAALVVGEAERLRAGRSSPS